MWLDGRAEVVSGPLWTIAQSAVCMIVPISHFYHG